MLWEWLGKGSVRPAREKRYGHRGSTEFGNIYVYRQRAAERSETFVARGLDWSEVQAIIDVANDVDTEYVLIDKLGREWTGDIESMDYSQDDLDGSELFTVTLTLDNPTIDTTP